MAILWFAAIVCLILSVLFLFFPQKLTKIAEDLNKVVIHTNSDVSKNRIAVGVILLLLSLTCFYTIYKIITT